MARVMYKASYKRLSGMPDVIEAESDESAWNIAETAAMNTLRVKSAIDIDAYTDEFRVYVIRRSGRREWIANYQMEYSGA